MKNKDRLILVILIAFFVIALVKLFALRFEWGDVYPQYSSLRADPLGTKILYESLENLEGMTVNRNYHSFSRMTEGNSTYFFIGMRREQLNSLTEDEINSLETIATGGGRLLFLFYPEEGCKCETDKGDEDEATLDEDIENNEKDSSEEDKNEADPVLFSIEKRWNFEAHLSQSDGKDIHRTYDGFLSVKNESLPEMIEIHSHLYFEKDNDQWETIYSRENLPVVMERDFGKGSVVLLADSYFTSNEALTGEKETDLLVWLLGANSEVVIDETHLGVSNHPGVASLARKYNMEGLIAALLLVAFLFIWRNGSSFIPPHREENSGRGEKNAHLARDHLTGFKGLLKRTIPVDTLLSVCLREWEKSVGKGGHAHSGRVGEVHAFIKESGNADEGKFAQINQYKRISKLLSERKFK